MAQASLAVKRETENSSDDSLEATVKGMVSIRIQRSASMVTTASVTPTDMELLMRQIPHVGDASSWISIM
jgi:phage FluMu protein gp41